MTIEDRDTYLEKLTGLLRGCFENEANHAVLVVGNDHTRIMGVYAVNANQDQVGALVTAVATYCLEDVMTERTVN